MVRMQLPRAGGLLHASAGDDGLAADEELSGLTHCFVSPLTLRNRGYTFGTLSFTWVTDASRHTVLKAL